MEPTRRNVINALIALCFAIAVGGFIFLGTRGDDNPNELALIENTTTTRSATSAPQQSTTSTTARLTTTSVLTTTATTARPTTATTKRPTTATTKRPSSSPTTAVTGPSGRVNERSDNTASFSHGEDGSFRVSSTDPPAGADPFRFVLKTAQGSGGVSGDTASVKFIVTLTNNTSRSIGFPGGLRIVVTMRAPGGGDLVFNMTAADVTNINSRETITLTQERGVSGYGTFDASATCDVDYG